MAEDLRHFLAQQPGPSLKLLGSPISSPVEQPHSKSAASARHRILTAGPSRSCPKACGPSTPTTPIFFSNCCQARGIATVCPTAFVFGKTASKKPMRSKTFAVGLIYGPSGCGKSSLVKAGLLPRLSDNVIAVYVEATAEETEARLLERPAKTLSRLAGQPGSESKPWPRCVADRALPAGKKVLIVLDQFEQWLHASKGSGEHRTGASPAAMRRQPGAVHRHGAG